ncbi:MAG TPA: type II toxin-antitoxin system VapC family toxin [Thermoanaerobaculia bacterium]|nr:type II toxin-antitoxin system VapC family toxin [Thermoanaerobaculia bacterium]
MSSGVVYLDASALVKLVSDEAETTSLQSSLADWPRRMSSCVAEVELMRAARRGKDVPRASAAAREVLAKVVLLEVDSTVRGLAATLEPPVLRALDAIHLASALTLGGTLEAFVTYDRRLFAAALAAGLVAVAPGQAGTAP